MWWDDLTNCSSSKKEQELPSAVVFPTLQIILTVGVAITIAFTFCKKHSDLICLDNYSSVLTTQFLIFRMRWTAPSLQALSLLQQLSSPSQGSLRKNLRFDNYFGTFLQQSSVASNPEPQARQLSFPHTFRKVDSTREVSESGGKFVSMHYAEVVMGRWK